MNLPEITQDNFRILLPGKIAKTVMMIAEERHCPPVDALLAFYESETYRMLEIEKTKYWWMSPLQLYRVFCDENKNK